jgi:hypothetical protein
MPRSEGISMERAAGEQDAGDPRDAGSSGEITAQELRAVFPQWRIFRAAGAWRAIREGTAKFDGPKALIQHVHTAPDLITLADKLCLQEHLDGLNPEELAEVWRAMALPVPEAAR